MSEIKVEVNAGFHELLEENLKWEKQNNEKYLQYRKKWDNNPLSYIIEKAPIHLDIETSSICNLKCPMCVYTIEKEKGENSAIQYGLMDWEIYKKIIDEAASIGVYSIKLNWRGEPTMNNGLADMVRYAKKNGIIDIMFNTNAVKLDSNLSRNLINAGLDKIFFSIDSINPDKYAKIRIGADLDQVLKNIQNFVEYNEKVGHPVLTRVQKVLMENTNDENEQYKDYFSNIVDQVAFADYVPFGERGFGKEIERGKEIKYACSQLWQRLLITWDGEYRACCFSGHIPFVLGNVADSSIEEIWKGNKLNALRESHRKGEWYKCEMCKKCYMPYM